MKADKLHALWNVLALTGMRRGEALALKWNDVSVDYKRISIRRAMTQASGKVYLAVPKALQGRAIDLFPETAAALRRHKRAETRWHSKVTGSSFIFQRPEGGLLNPGSVTRGS